jgi:hypothetical protein
MHYIPSVQLNMAQAGQINLTHEEGIIGTDEGK